MTGKVAVIPGASRGIGAGLVAAYRGRGRAVVASARTIKPSEDSDVFIVAGDIVEPATADRIIGGALERPAVLDLMLADAPVKAGLAGRRACHDLLSRTEVTRLQWLSYSS